MRLGLGYVPQGREIFPRLTVEENLLMGLASKSRGAASDIPTDVFEMFPVLKHMLRRRGGDLSGGQRRAEAIGSTEQLMAAVMEARFPRDICAGAPVSPVVLERSCRGVRVQVVAALEVGSEDRIVVEPVAPAAPTSVDGSLAKPP